MESELSNRLQHVDNLFAELHDQAKIRFVERQGDTLERKLERSDPWAGEFFCQKERCMPCKTRREIKMRDAAGREMGEPRRIRNIQG